MNTLGKLNFRTVSSATAALALTLAITLAVSWMFADTVRLAKAELDLGRDTAVTISALVR